MGDASMTAVSGQALLEESLTSDPSNLLHRRTHMALSIARCPNRPGPPSAAVQVASHAFILPVSACHVVLAHSMRAPVFFETPI